MGSRRPFLPARCWASNANQYKTIGKIFATHESVNKAERS